VSGPLVVLTRDELRALILEAVVEALASSSAGAELVDVADLLPMTKRCAYAHAPKIPGARKVGRKWLATREACAAYVESLAPRTPAAPAADVAWSPAVALSKVGR
jgi:hypothetical protein